MKTAMASIPGFRAKEIKAIWDKLQINTLQRPWWAFFPSQGHWPWGSNSSVDKASPTARVLIAGTGGEEEQRSQQRWHHQGRALPAQNAAARWDRELHPHQQREMQQAHQEPEGNQVTQAYPFITCYFWAARVQLLTLDARLQALFKVHLKRNGTFNQAPYCRNKHGILTTVIQLIIHT